MTRSLRSVLLRRCRVPAVLALSAAVFFGTASRSGRAAVVPASAPHAAAPTTQQLAIETLNVFGLPWPLAPDARARCERIAAHLAVGGGDVVALQEVWSDDVSAPFAMPDFHRARCECPVGMCGASGLMTLSRHPIRRAETRFFASEGGIERLVSKGALRTIVALPDGELDVWNLHLQSGVADVATRSAQVDELLAWLRTDAATTRCAVLGDFNCAPGEPEFARLLAGLRELGFVHASPRLPTYDAGSNALAEPEPAREIDHVFVRGFAVRGARRTFDEPGAGGHCSDHYGVGVHVGAAQADTFGR